MKRMRRAIRLEENDKNAIRLNRYLAMLGIGSRRACDEIISSGRVHVDGVRVKAPGLRIIPAVNNITVNGKSLSNPPERTIVLLNKPNGVITTMSDPLGRRTVIDLCRRQGFKMRLFSVGRLDINTSGAILLTNDGLLCYRLTHPRFRIPRVYNVRVRGAATEKRLRRLKKLASPIGELGEDMTVEPKVELVRGLNLESILKVILFEGRNRQVRRICEETGLKVLKLKRVSFAGISIRKLPSGFARRLTKKEIDQLEGRLLKEKRQNGHRPPG